MQCKSNDNISYKVQTRKFSSEPQNSQITQGCYEEIANCLMSQPTKATKIASESDWQFSSYRQLLSTNTELHSLNVNDEGQMPPKFNHFQGSPQHILQQVTINLGLLRFQFFLARTDTHELTKTFAFLSVAGSQSGEIKRTTL